MTKEQFHFINITSNFYYENSFKCITTTGYLKSYFIIQFSDNMIIFKTTQNKVFTI